MTEANDRAGERRYAWANGRLASVEVDGTATGLATDGLGTIIDIRRNGALLVAYAYDPVGRVTGAAYADGTVATYAYDARGLRSKAAYTRNGGTANAALGYDAVGNLIGYALNLPDGRRLVQSYELGPFNEVKHIVNEGLSTDPLSFDYDGAGRVTAVQAGNRSAAVDYDDVDRVVRVDLDGETKLVASTRATARDSGRGSTTSTSATEPPQWTRP